MSQFYVYILASRRDGALYVGVTNDLVRRVYEHRQKLIPGHTQRYQIERLVYFEVYFGRACNSAREEHQALAKGLEDQSYRRVERNVARLV